MFLGGLLCTACGGVGVVLCVSVIMLLSYLVYMIWAFTCLGSWTS